MVTRLVSNWPLPKVEVSTVSVTIRIPTVLRAHTGGEAIVSFSGNTIGEVLSAAVAAHPGLSGQVIGEDGNFHKFVNVYVNDDDVRYLEGTATPVADGDEITILPAVAGGAH
jgi:molybdopterin converting factor small subunit